jgi:hypothetical protein
MLEKQRQPHPHMDDDHRRAVVEGHHLGQYPPEGFEVEYDDEDEHSYDEEMDAEDY